MIELIRRPEDQARSARVNYVSLKLGDHIVHFRLARVLAVHDPLDKLDQAFAVSHASSVPVPGPGHTDMPRLVWFCRK